MSESHDLSPGQREKKVGLAILLNLGIAGAEVAGGVASGSLALLSDALHNVGDAFSLVVSWAALRLAGRKNDDRRTFGYKRAEVLAALFNTALILGASLFMIKEAVGRVLHPVLIDGGVVVVLGLVGLVGNVGSILLLRREARDSLNIRSSYLHLLSDAFASMGVLAGGV